MSNLVPSNGGGLMRRESRQMAQALDRVNAELRYGLSLLAIVDEAEASSRPQR